MIQGFRGLGSLGSFFGFRGLGYPLNVFGGLPGMCVLLRIIGAPRLW